MIFCFSITFLSWTKFDFFSCAAALKMLEIFEREDLVEQSRVKGEYFKNKFLELQKKYPEIIKDVRGLGLSIGVDLCDKNTTTKNPGL